MLKPQEIDTRKMIYIKLYVDDCLSKSELSLLEAAEFGVYVRFLLRLAKSPKKGYGYLESGLPIGDTDWADLLKIPSQDWDRLKVRFLDLGIAALDKRGALWAPRFKKHQSEWFRIKDYASQSGKGRGSQNVEDGDPGSGDSADGLRNSAEGYRLDKVSGKAGDGKDKGTETEPPASGKEDGKPYKKPTKDLQNTYYKHQHQNQHQHKDIKTARVAGKNLPDLTDPKATCWLIMDYWNSQERLVKVKKLTDTRIGHVMARLKELDFREGWQMVIDKVNASDFCCGSGSQGWKATFDWIVKSPNNYIKVLEGAYDNRPKGGAPEKRRFHNWSPKERKDE